MDGDREDDAEPSPVLGITGNRLLSLRLTGAGLGVSNDDLSLVQSASCLQSNMYDVPCICTKLWLRGTR